MSLNRLWAAPKLPRLSFNHLAVSGCTTAVPPFRSAWAVAGGSSTQPPRHALLDGRPRGHRTHSGPRFASRMTETTPLAPTTTEAAAAMERLAAWVIGALTFIVIGGIALVIYVPRGGHAGGSSWLPEINASLNATATVLLSTGYVFIRRRRIAAHRTCMIAAFAASSLFLITYLIHHARVGSVPFHGAAWLRPVYFGLLVPHIVLAAFVVPLALTTIHRAWRGRFDRHPQIARVTLPIWLYVSISGVLVYVLLYHSGR